MQSGTAVCGGGTKAALPGREPPIPILRAPKLAWQFRAAAPARQQNGVDLANQPIRERESLPQAP